MKSIILLVLFMLNFMAHTQIDPVEVADLTVKIGALDSEVLYYGFAEGDQIIFGFEEQSGNAIKEITVTELPSNSKFADFKSSELVDKKISVNKNGVYAFTFRNGSMSGRVCHIRIQRIPKSEDLITFNTNWEWKTIYDTSYTPYTLDSLIGYDTLRYKETIKELIKTEKLEDLIMDRTERVHSYWNSNSSYTYVKVTIPETRNTAYRKEKIMGWAYWIGVGEESKQAYAKNVQEIGKITKSITSSFSPLGAIAIGAATELLTPKTGDDVSYAFMNGYENVKSYLNNLPYYQFEKGKGIAAYGKNTSKLSGDFYIGLHNDNDTRGIDVNVKIVILKEVKHYKDIIYNRHKLIPKYATLNKQQVKITSSRIRINSN